MPTSQTLVTIYNMALDIVVEAPISTTTDNSPFARWMNRNFVPTVEAALRQNVWNFATELHVLNKATIQPAFRWRYQYHLPPGWLRVLPLTRGGERGGLPIPYEVKRNMLMTNAGSPLRVELVMNVQDPGEWDPLFATMIAARLAVGLAHRFTGKSFFVKQAQRIAADAMEQAEEINAYEGSLQPVEQHDIIRVRSDYEW